jgi:LmbE family N-acetylglucosaminyl deacetylase
MLIEADTIPYDAARLLGERLLVLAPHPDDEVIGCGGLVAQHMAQRRAVRVIVATDGAEAEPSAVDRDGYRRQREDESRRALAILGDADVHFLRFADRALDNAVAEPLREHLLAFRPDLICVPSPVEIHPDHLALSRAFCELVQRDATLFADLAIARVAFYEVSQPLRPNTLVDITDVAERKYQDVLTGLQPLLQQDPQNKNIQRMIIDSHFNLGAAALQEERLPDARREFEEVLKSDPNDELAKRSKDLADRYDGQPKDLLYRIYVKYLPLRQAPAA